MLSQVMACVFGVMFIVFFCTSVWGAALMVCDRQRAWHERREELVSRGEADGDDTGREGQEEDS
jgi:hypothetical protein